MHKGRYDRWRARTALAAEQYHPSAAPLKPDCHRQTLPLPTTSDLRFLPAAITTAAAMIESSLAGLSYRRV